MLVTYDEQSPDIAQGVDEGEGLDLEQGAGDQGLMFGYACDETPRLMPLPIHLAHRLVERQAELRHNGRLPWLRPDAKSQVTVRYEGGRAVEIDTVVLSTQHAPEIEHKALTEAVIEEIIKPVLPKDLVSKKIKYLVNPTGRFVVGGPKGDTRPHRPQDHRRHLRRRRAARRRRFLRQGSVEGRPLGGLCRALRREEHGRGRARAPLPRAGVVCDRRCAADQRDADDLRHRPGAGREDRGAGAAALRPAAEGHRPDAGPVAADLRKTASYGHFGRELPEFTWEKTDKAAFLAAEAGLKSRATA